MSDQVRILSVVGEIDVTTVDRLRSALLSLLDDRARLVIDLSGCTFCDTIGAGALAMAVSYANLRGAVVGWAGANGVVATVLDGIVPAARFPSIDEAIRVLTRCRVDPSWLEPHPVIDDDGLRLLGVGERPPNNRKRPTNSRPY
jgi:anti-anti-sigma factor